MSAPKITNDELLDVVRRTLVKHHGKDWDVYAVRVKDIKAVGARHVGRHTITRRLKILVAEGKLVVGMSGFYMWPNTNRSGE